MTDLQSKNMIKKTQEQNNLLGNIEDIAFVLQNIASSIIDSVTDNEIIEQGNSPCLVGAIYEHALQARKIADAITPFTGLHGTDATGGGVGSLTEAVMGVTSGLCKIAEAINRLAEAVEDHP